MTPAGFGHLAARPTANYASGENFPEVDPMGATAAWKLMARFSGRGSALARAPEHRTTTTTAGRRLRWTRRLALGAVMMTLAPGFSDGAVLTENDFRKVEAIKPLFQNLMGDLVQTLKRPDLPTADAECINSTMRELLQISEELSSYEYLITIEKEIADVGDDSPIKGVVKFAIEKTNTILTEERKRLIQLSDRCSRSPLALGKAQAAIQFIDTTTGLLNSIQVRL
jgi:hypothetical protein